MFSTILKEVNGYLDRRFVLTLVFPSLIFWTGLIVVLLWKMGIENALSVWSEQDTTLQVVQIMFGVAWLVFFALLLDNLLNWITRLFEGYWDGMLFGLGKYLRTWRAKHYQKVIEQSDRQTIYYYYPPSNASKTYLEFVMPTRLGNILRNCELYPYERYKIDAVLIWPRLLTVLPESFTKGLESAKSSLNLMLIVSFLSGLFALVAGVYMLAAGFPWQGSLGCILGGLIAARLAYTSALGAAITYGQLIKSAFDVFKDALLQKMGYEKPKTLDEERKFWENLCQFLYRNFPQDLDVLRYAGSVRSDDKNGKRPPIGLTMGALIVNLVQKIARWFF